MQAALWTMPTNPSSKSGVIWVPIIITEYARYMKIHYLYFIFFSITKFGAKSTGSIYSIVSCPFSMWIIWLRPFILCTRLKIYTWTHAKTCQ